MSTYSPNKTCDTISQASEASFRMAIADNMQIAFSNFNLTKSVINRLNMA